MYENQIIIYSLIYNLYIITNTNYCFYFLIQVRQFNNFDERICEIYRIKYLINSFIFVICYVKK
jgi:hypothetical protein